MEEMEKDVKIEVDITIQGKTFKKSLTANFRDKADIPVVMEYFDAGCFGQDDELEVLLDVSLTEICPSSTDAFKDIEVF